MEKERRFRDAIALCSDPEVLARAYNNLADLYETKGYYSKGLVYYRKAIEKKKDLATPYQSVGDIFFKLGDYYSAFIMYGKALRYKPDDEELLGSRKKAGEGFKKKMVIYFDLNSFRVSELYVYRLQLIGQFITSNSTKKKVEIVGHTCDLGSKRYNKSLSKKRAAAVVKYLKEHFPIAENVITVRYEGEEDPLLPNRDNEARTLNRRVEVIIPNEG